MQKNLGHLLEGTRAFDEESLWLAAHHVLLNYGLGSSPAVQNQISESMLDLLGEMLKDLPREATRPSRALWRRIQRCKSHLKIVLRSLSKPQRQNWVSLLVEALHGTQAAPTSVHKSLLGELLLLWRADDNPRQTYAKALGQLEALRKSEAFRDSGPEFDALSAAC